MTNFLSPYIRRGITIAIAMLAMVTLDSCKRIDFAEEGMVNPEQTDNKVRVTTRTTSGIVYPLTLYAFDGSSEKLVTSTSVDNESEEILLALPAGQYHLVAVAGSSECAIPTVPALADHIVIPANGRLENPLQMGSVDVPVNGDATVNITMYNQVAAIDLSLEGLPQDVTSASITLSTLHNRLSFGGALSGNVGTTVQLQRGTSDNVWIAPRFYTLSSSSDRLTFSITTEAPSGTQTYGYAHAGTLQANTPYNLIGNYAEGVVVNGVVSLAGWNQPEEILFNLGVEENISPDGGTTDGGEVSSVPEAGSFWNGHFVAYSEIGDNGTTAHLLLLSLSEWTGVPSAMNEEEPDLAVELAAEYVEEDLTGWSIPTREEVKSMRTTIGGENLSATNVCLAEYGAILLSDDVKDLEGNKLRYLCDDGAFSFTWTGSNISTCGSKRTYNLRMVKSVTVTLK